MVESECNEAEENISQGSQVQIPDLSQLKTQENKKLENVGQEIKDKFGMQEFQVEVNKIEKKE